MIEFFLFLPQMRMSFERIVATARAAEASGFKGMSGMDHFVPPGAENQPLYEAMITNTWLAAHTSRLKLSSLVLCDALRHPALLAKQAISLDHASAGRFELGIGWGSYAPDFETFGTGPSEPRERVQRLRETLEVLRALWAGETVNYDGQFHHLRGAMQAPVPLTKIPILIGGSGPKTLALVREFADWWNFDLRHIEKLKGDQFEQLQTQIGKARVSIQQMVAFVPKGGDAQAVREMAKRRFGYADPVTATAPQLVEHFSRLAERGVERVYVWFCDFAPPETLAAFGQDVIGPLSA